MKEKARCPYCSEIIEVELNGIKTQRSICAVCGKDFLTSAGISYFKSKLANSIEENRSEEEKENTEEKKIEGLHFTEQEREKLESEWNEKQTKTSKQKSNTIKLPKALLIWLIVCLSWFSIWIFVKSPQDNNIVKMRKCDEFTNWVNTTWQSANSIDDLEVGYNQVREKWKNMTGIDVDWNTAKEVVLKDFYGGNISSDYFSSKVEQYVEKQQLHKNIPFFAIGIVMALSAFVISISLGGKPRFATEEEKAQKRALRKELDRQHNFDIAKQKYVSAQNQLHAHVSYDADLSAKRMMAEAEADMLKYKG